MRRPRPLGLRAGVTVSFTLGATALATLAAIGTHAVTREYLLGQREDTAVRQAFVDASSVRDGLRTSGVTVADVLGAVAPPTGSELLVRRDGRWYSGSLQVGADDVPAELSAAVASGTAGVTWTRVGDESAIAVGVPLPVVGAEFYEVTLTDELDRTLLAVRNALAAFALSTALGGALLGAWASRRAVAPLHAVARTAASIAGGELGSRLPPTTDPDLATIVGSFNSMVDALEEQIQREVRFSADVSHELRSPLTTLVTSVALLQRRRDELPQRSQQALDLVGRELDRFQQTLDDLLELARLESGTASRPRVRAGAVDLARQALDGSGRPHVPVRADDDGAQVDVDVQQLARALVNLFDNADRHGEGLVEVGVQRSGDRVRFLVDDAGPGVPAGERQRVFERFARAGSRGSLPGSGLGLSLVAETVRAHDGSVRCAVSPRGGARFVVELPVARALAGVGGGAPGAGRRA
ncbi:HAMP domain-containing histidine kinase [Paenibacillus sp. TRM 82003]|uniref:HAMP domain-containing sensor histidine kinase n=1 Tax=Kineococcus sp. TRM81007 TaxID=2925831 RepID=UPI001F59C6FA|nr:HAMP domain-containing sensor histidine kinase [Kineococcus sp. TRM81007]MCI2237580.1 HAMP domain-containing histidine kinase [Kineococcus sp. TRM81007]MCI3921848.1 HAMP domain-containing histidine kinase [Paenibacillus sp. TRM 82003]